MNSALPKPVQIESSLACYHCDLPVPSPGLISNSSGDEVRHFCCAGCAAVTGFIEAGGLERYYQLRERPGRKPDAGRQDRYEVYDRPGMQEGWLQRSGTRASAEILVGGITCAACVWLIEEYLGSQAAVESVTVNLSNARLSVVFDEASFAPSEIFRLLEKIGYTASPWSITARRQHDLDRRQDLLKRLGVAAGFGMQIMVISVALYAGDWFGMEQGVTAFLMRINLLLCLPVLFYAATPFFSSAVRSLRTRNAGMDVPISLALLLAFAGSVWSIASGTGEIYFDSIAMFVFFLLGARLLECNARLRGAGAMDQLASATPEIACRLTNPDQYGATEIVPAATLTEDERVLVKPGEAVPADSVLVGDGGQFDESLLTGEQVPVAKQPGDHVLAGSINVGQPACMTVVKAPALSTLASILRLADRAGDSKPRVAELAERIASWFVLSILGIAGLVAVNGIAAGDKDWLSTVIAVLVVTCPCALSLATPLALTAGANAMIRQGICVVQHHAIETLSRVQTLLFDKTGTLTTGDLEMVKVTVFDTLPVEDCEAIAAALEQHSAHPVARAIVRHHAAGPLPRTSDLQDIPGYGVSASIDGEHFVIGSPGAIERHLPRAPTGAHNPQLDALMSSTTNTVILLARRGGLVAAFEFADQLRDGAKTLIDYLEQRQIGYGICSGDRNASVAAVARQLGIRAVEAGCSPKRKLQILDRLLANNRIVAMAGDGINDAPALNRAHLGIAFARNVNLAAANADIIISSPGLGALQAAHEIAKRTVRIIRQNLAWAILYNLAAVPAAIAGLVPPWLAGIGMSLSSAVVVLNAARLNRRTTPGHD